MFEKLFCKMLLCIATEDESPIIIKYFLELLNIIHSSSFELNYQDFLFFQQSYSESTVSSVTKFLDLLAL